MQSDRIECAAGGERISLEGYFQKRRSFFALFLIACALLVGAFALTYLWADGGDNWLGGGTPPLESNAESDDAGTEASPSETERESDTASETDAARETEEATDGSPAGTPIRTVELSRGAALTYINNESVHLPNAEALLARDVSSPPSEEPLVLILHTHTSEGYASGEQPWIEGVLGETTYTSDGERSVLAAGRALSDTLRACGVGTIHCTTVHDGDGLRGAYASSAESVRFFLSLYPSIRYVIDLHRDAILDADGAYLRTVSELPEGECAQVMAVVGSDGSGTPCDNWEGNLALALQLRRALNGEVGSVCRPVTLRNSSYNQELGAYALLLEIGTGGNSVSEAERTARLVGRALARLILGN